MVEVAQRVQKIGGSLMVRIPKDVADSKNIKEGDTVYFEPKLNGINLLGLYPDIESWRKEPNEFHSKHL